MDLDIERGRLLGLDSNMLLPAPRSAALTLTPEQAIAAGRAFVERAGMTPFGEGGAALRIVRASAFENGRTGYREPHASGARLAWVTQTRAVQGRARRLIAVWIGAETGEVIGGADSGSRSLSTVEYDRNTDGLHAFWAARSLRLEAAPREPGHAMLRSAREDALGFYGALAQAYPLSARGEAEVRPSRRLVAVSRTGVETAYGYDPASGRLVGPDGVTLQAGGLLRRLLARVTAPAAR